MVLSSPEKTNRLKNKGDLHSRNLRQCIMICIRKHFQDVLHLTLALLSSFGEGSLSVRVEGNFKLWKY